MSDKAQYSIEKKKNGRYSVRKRGGGFINGEEKTKILAEKNLIKLSKANPKPKEEEATEAE